MSITPTVARFAASTADILARGGLRRRARQEVARGILSAPRLGSEGTSDSPTVADIRFRVELALALERERFDRRAGELLVDYRAYLRRRGVLADRVEHIARTEPGREDALAQGRRLHRRLSRADLGASELRPRLEREVDRLRVRAARVVTRGDRELAHFHRAVLLLHPHGSHLTLAPPRVAVPSWLAARDLDEFVAALFPTAEEAHA